MSIPAPKPAPPVQLRRCETCQATTPHDKHCPGVKCPWFTCRVCGYTRDTKGRSIKPTSGRNA